MCLKVQRTYMHVVKKIGNTRTAFNILSATLVTKYMVLLNALNELIIAKLAYLTKS